MNQKEFADKIGKPQSVISRLEDTEYGKVSVKTLLDIAFGTGVALIIKFASYPTFLVEYEDLSQNALAVESIEESLNQSRSWLTDIPLSSHNITASLPKSLSVPAAMSNASNMFWSLQTSPVATIDPQGNPIP